MKSITWFKCNCSKVHQDLASEVLPKVTPEPVATAERVVIAEQHHINIDTGE